MAGCVSLGHDYATVFHSSFEGVLHIGGIGRQRCGQLVVQHIAGVVADAALGLVGVCRRQADGGENGVAAIEAIQHTYLPLAVYQFIVHADVGQLQIGELHTLHGVGRERVDDGIVMQAGGDVGLCIPRAIRTGFGDIVLVDVQGRFPTGVDGRCCESCGHQGEGHERCQQQRQYAMDLFHVQ